MAKLRPFSLHCRLSQLPARAAQAQRQLDYLAAASARAQRRLLTGMALLLAAWALLAGMGATAHRLPSAESAAAQPAPRAAH